MNVHKLKTRSSIVDFRDLAVSCESVAYITRHRADTPAREECGTDVYIYEVDAIRGQWTSMDYEEALQRLRDARWGEDVGES